MNVEWPNVSGWSEVLEVFAKCHWLCSCCCTIKHESESYHSDSGGRGQSGVFYYSNLWVFFSVLDNLKRVV